MHGGGVAQDLKSRESHCRIYTIKDMKKACRYLRQAFLH